MLEESDFSDEAKERIIDADVKHGKRFNDPADSPILAGLRLCDKLDRLGDYGIITGAIAVQGSSLPIFDPRHPFGYGSTVDGKLKSAYDNWMRVTEWVSDEYMDDEDRKYLDAHAFRERNRTIRRIATYFAVTNGVEHFEELIDGDFRKALGRHYVTYAMS
jgi:hypothetical protein